MAIPEGYRLLTKDDVGKVFGKDLELQIYIDTSADPVSDIFIGNRTNFINEDDGIIHLDYSSLSNHTIYYYSWYISSNDVITMDENLVVEIYYDDDNWNNWFYVKDIPDPYTITIKNKSGITLLVEGKYLTKDITILLDKSLFGESGEEEGGGESGGTNTWSIEDVSGASYGFALNSAGYYESKNKGKTSSYAICKVNLDIKSDCKMYVDCINYAESNYDYGLLSNLDKTLTLSHSADTSNVFKSFKGLQSPNVVAVDYGTITAGSHFIYIKFIKDSSQNSNNDTLQFKVRLE